MRYCTQQTKVEFSQTSFLKFKRMWRILDLPRPMKSPPKSANAEVLAARISTTSAILVQRFYSVSLSYCKPTVFAHLALRMIMFSNLMNLYEKCCKRASGMTFLYCKNNNIETMIL